MKFVYYASLLGGRMDPSDVIAKEKEYREHLTKSIQEFIQSMCCCHSYKFRTCG